MRHSSRFGRGQLLTTAHYWSLALRSSLPVWPIMAGPSGILVCGPNGGFRMVPVVNFFAMVAQAAGQDPAYH